MYYKFMDGNSFLSKQNKIFLTSAIILAILSLIGGVWLFFSLRQPQVSTAVIEEQPSPTSIPTPEETIVPTIEPTSTIKPKQSTSSATPTLKPTVKPTSIPTPTPTLAITPTPASTSLIDFNSTDDNFSISYNPVRKLYQDSESSGNRYTFALSSGNFAIHAGKDWSWSYPNRTYTSDFLINNQPTFRYDINTQTIVDVQYNGKNYTIQCVHNGSSTLKAECEQFLKSFKFL
jgi:hypothetical protein